MYGMDMLIGGRSDARFERALRDSLRVLGVTTDERTTVPELAGRYRWAQDRAKLRTTATQRGTPTFEVPSVAWWPARSGGQTYVAIDVRTPRSPMWNLGLARQLSARLGGWAAVVVNDRLYDHYGYGFFCAGQVIEAAARTISRVVFHVGPGAIGLPDLDEDVNRARFWERAHRLAGPADRRDVHACGAIDVLELAAPSGGSLFDAEELVAEDSATARAWLDVAAPPAAHGYVYDRSADRVAWVRELAGCEVSIATMEPSWEPRADFTLDEEPQPTVAVVRGAAGDALTRDARDVAALVFRFDRDRVAVSRRELGAGWSHTDARGVDAVLDAYDALTVAARTTPIHWDGVACGSSASASMP